MVPSEDVSPEQGEKLLDRTQAKSALIIPVRTGDKDVALSRAPYRLAEMGLINPLTAWVLRSALRQTRLCSMAGKNFSIAINLSTRDLQQEDIAAEIPRISPLPKLAAGAGYP